MKTLTIALLLLILTSCENKPTSKVIDLTYDLQNSTYRRIDAFLFENPKIELSCELTNTSPYDGTYTIKANIISEKAETKNIELRRYIKSGQTIKINHKEEIKRNTFQKIDIKKFNITASILIDTKTRLQIY